MMERRPSAIAIWRSRCTLVGTLAALCAGLVPAKAGRAAGDISPLEVVSAVAARDDGAAVARPLSAARSSDARRGEDRLLLISSRALGTRCDARAMADGLRCEQRDSNGRWRSAAWSAVLAEFAAEPMPTVIYVHGNRVASGDDKTHGLEFYRWLAARKPADAPLRYVIWSWPSTQIPGRLKDYEVKAARTRPCGWQLAWAIDQLPAETPLAVVGYSYGARVTTGALHVLGGGRLGDLELAERAHPERPPMTVALVAAAVEASWLRPGGFHGKAISQCQTLVLTNNRLDPAMRYYHFSPEGHQEAALGYAGVPGRDSLGDLAGRVRTYDLTNSVGRHHALGAYLSSASMLGRALEPVLALPSSAPVPSSAAESAMAGRGASGRQ
jgi:hypothetical protein